MQFIKMDSFCSYIPYNKTGYFSSIVIDYLNQSEQLKPYYLNLPTREGILNSIKQKCLNKIDRKSLVQYFKKQYQGTISEQQQNNIDLLLQENCYTITTAHQPNIFTGPLYFIYKILHTIKLANELNEDFKSNHFVPVYFMGSEDADINELGNISIQEKELSWNTKQTGAVGRMIIDNEFINLISEIHGQIGVNKFGDELTEIFKKCYTIGKSIQLATFELVNILFAEFGLLVLISDDTDLKKLFIPTLIKEVSETFSSKAVEITNNSLNKFYKIQASGRNINLFYLIDDKRERIELVGEVFIISKLNLEFTLEELIIDIKNHPERFSPNVILRPIYQETILPNIAFIGGGGEIAYWLQLKKVFNNLNIPYPILILRNSFLLYKTNQESKLQKMGLEIQDLFLSKDELLNNLVTTQSQQNLSLQTPINSTKEVYNKLIEQATTIDATLIAHINNLSKKAVKKIEQLEKKLFRAEKRKFTVQETQLSQLKLNLFPNNNLQERVENFSYLYSLYGKSFFTTILESSKGVEQEFGLIKIDKNKN